MALRSGGKSPPGRNLRIFYSSYARCVHTARDIAEGYRTMGGSAELVSDIPVLVGPLGDPREIAEQRIQMGGLAFMVKWSKGELPQDMIGPMESFCDRFVANIIRPFASAKPSELQLHVTHDLVIMAARPAFFKTRPTERDWTQFLGGFGAAMDERGIHIFENGKARTSPELASLLESR